MNPRILYLIKRAEIEVTSRMTRALDKYKITVTQFTVLYFVWHDKGDLSSAQLSRRFSMTPQSMNELIGVLQRKRLLKKAVDPSHKRILRISLTAKGRQLLKDCNTALDHVEEELVTGMSNAEAEKFKELVGKILASGREKIS
jgi:DNA-binding MarR family transcriptional regulator